MSTTTIALTSKVSLTTPASSPVSSQTKEKPLLDFYHEITCKCGKNSFIDDFKTPRDKSTEEQVCEDCGTLMKFLKIARCDCGNWEGVACLNPMEECDICNGSCDKMSDDDDNPECFNFIEQLKQRRDEKRGKDVNEAKLREVGQKIIELLTSLDLGEEPDEELVKDLKNMATSNDPGIPDEAKAMLTMMLMGGPVGDFGDEEDFNSDNDFDPLEDDNTDDHTDDTTDDHTDDHTDDNTDDHTDDHTDQE
jgi:hypothetical protein